METKFQTSFIPKKPLITNERSSSTSGVSIFMFLAVIIFVISIAGAGFTIVWKNLLIKSQEQYKIDLSENEKRFNIKLIEELKKSNIKIDLAKKLLNNHLAVSETFDIISKLTIDGVVFKSLDFTSSGVSLDTSSLINTDTNQQTNASSIAKISMKGVANSFSSIAFQSDVFGSSAKYGTNKILKNPVLSDLSTDEAGNVSFSFTADLMPSDISYSKVLISRFAQEGIVSPTSSSTNDQ